MPAKAKATFGKTLEQLGPQETNFNWLSNGCYRGFGRFILMRPQDPERAGLLIACKGSSHFPMVLISDDPKLRRPSLFTLADTAANTITVLDTNGDGFFEVLGMGTTNADYIDKGLTGSWQIRKNKNPNPQGGATKRQPSSLASELTSATGETKKQ
jgi:hypothetical protein